jgi:glycerophosphoryl diester phosphodiesterase
MLMGIGIWFLVALPRRCVRRPFVIAHRGNTRLCPENTVAAFRQAASDGADALETDLRVSRDGVFVCIHDATLDRTTDGHGPVASMSLADLRRLSASCGKGKFKTEQIPILEEVAGILPPAMALAIELKSDSFLEQEVCLRLARQLNDLGVIGRTMVLSFNGKRLERFREVAPEVPTGQVSLHSLLPPWGVEFVGPHWPLLVLNPFYVRQAHRRGQHVCPLDPRPDMKLRYYLWLGVDALLTNDPKATLNELQRLGADAPWGLPNRV